EREARAVAEKANKAKGDFLAAMSHELRTPLNAISGHVDLLALNLYGPTTPEQQAALLRVKRAGQHLLGIVDELLSFARLERGRVDYHITAVRLQDTLDDLAPMVNPLFVAKNISFSGRIEDPSLYVYADRGKLTQILINLLTNASKFTRTGGSVTLQAHEPPGRRAGDKGIVEISVTDTGIGIPADKLEAVFDPFVQLDTDPSMRQQGTGLGLAISRDLARGMGGDLVARSTAGESTTFILMLRKTELPSLG
ncbi:MAG TPA: HAMP domain-containing sensor histidine kinase, partial [Gemmatimonadaceae bacterium]|nr:HAMP domain-containing sensor histidine kinase [Gemmatimonadaceae bacterium]